MTDIRLQPATLADLDFVLKTEQHLDNAPWIGSWTRERYESSLIDANWSNLIVVMNGDRAGFVNIKGIEDPHRVMSLERIAIVVKGKGVGRTTLRLVKKLAFGEHNAHRLWLDVLSTNDRAIHLYESEGFVREGALSANVNAPTPALTPCISTLCSKTSTGRRTSEHAHHPRTTNSRTHRHLPRSTPSGPHRPRYRRYRLTEPKRCGWAAGSDDLMLAYHDQDWGVPVHDDRLLFEMITLEGAQAGLSWSTILNKRQNYRRAFERFNVKKIARYGDSDTQRLLANAGIVRNRLKISSTIDNARAFLAVQKEFRSFDAYIWQFVGGAPRRNKFRSIKQIPAKTAQSDAMSKDLKKRGFRFVGSTICYAFMQSTGMVNDHEVACFRYDQV